MAALSPFPTFNDLKITFHESCLVFPSQETEKRSVFLSNIDQILNYNIPTAYFFNPNPDFPFENVAKRFKMALEKVLVHYDFMAGRLKLNSKTGRLEMDVNGAGAGFIVASSEFTLNEMESKLVYPNLGYRQLAVKKLENLAAGVEQSSTFVLFPDRNVQVTSFNCGGFAIGMCINDILLDGLGAKTFVENLASQAFDDKPLQVIPCNERRLLAARYPPQVAFPHPEFLNLRLPIGEGSSPPVFDCSPEELEFKIFKLSPTKIAELKEIAKTATNTKISSFAVAAALIWRCKAFSGRGEEDRVSNLLNVVDIRPRRNPQLPSSYSGNGVLPVGVSATFEELEKWPFSKVVETFTKGAEVMTDEYIKSAFDWMEVHRGVPHGDYMVSSWLRLGFDRVDYPWGKPVYCCPVVNHRKDICWVFPDATDGGICAMVSLPGEEMEIFEGFFHEFIEQLGTTN